MQVLVIVVLNKLASMYSYGDVCRFTYHLPLMASDKGKMP